VGFDNRDVLITAEVVSIKGEETGNTIDLHGGDEPHIVHLHTRGRIPYQELTPLLIRSQTIWEETKVRLNDPRSLFGLSGREAKAATC
jgi:hypothetical protein